MQYITAWVRVIPSSFNDELIKYFEQFQIISQNTLINPFTELFDTTVL